MPFLVFHRDEADKVFQQLVGPLKPWGVLVCVYRRRDNLRHLKTRGEKGFYIKLGSGCSMDPVCLREGVSGAVEQFRHVLVPPVFAQQHAMRMHLGDKEYPPVLYDREAQEDAGDVFAVDDREVTDQAPYSDELLTEVLEGLDLFGFIRAALPYPTLEAVAVRGDSVAWD